MDLTWEKPVAERSRDAVLKVLKSLDSEVLGDPFILAIRCPEFTCYSSVQDMARGINIALKSVDGPFLPRALVFNSNVGKIVGGILDYKLSLPCIDEVKLSELDFIDIRKPVPGEDFVPVVVKSLTFGT